MMQKCSLSTTKNFIFEEVKTIPVLVGGRQKPIFRNYLKAKIKIES